MTLSHTPLWRGLFLLLCAALPLSVSASPDPGECPQPRFTGKAPDDYYQRRNPLDVSAANLRTGRKLYEARANGVACATCHGLKGDGKGELASQFLPPPRNFACARTVQGIPDGQLFWIIRFGSPDTAMPPHDKLADEQIWQLVLHLRELAK